VKCSRWSVGGFVADLPGLRRLSLWDTEPEELDGYFPEFTRSGDGMPVQRLHPSPGTGLCGDSSCEDGKVNPERYESYLKLRYGNPEER